jgi:uncharacterized OsmC-like protein
MTTNAATTATNAINGVDVDQVLGLIDTIGQDSNVAKTQFRAHNKWLGGGLNRSDVKDFSVGGAKDTSRTKPFEMHADEPVFLAGQDAAPNPVEFILHALAGCLTTTLVYHAAVRGIEVGGIETELEGDLDLRGIFGLSPSVRKGYQDVRVHMTVQSKATAEELRELAMFSPVYEMISTAVPVTFTIETV